MQFSISWVAMPLQRNSGWTNTLASQGLKWLCVSISDVTILALPTGLLFIVAISEKGMVLSQLYDLYKLILKFVVRSGLI